MAAADGAATQTNTATAPAQAGAEQQTTQTAAEPKPLAKGVNSLGSAGVAQTGRASAPPAEAQDKPKAEAEKSGQKTEDTGASTAAPKPGRLMRDGVDVTD